jgi:hypothetical protein
VRTIKYIDQEDFDPSKVTKYAVLDPEVLRVAKLCLAASERGEVQTFSPEESSSELDKLGDAIRELEQKSKSRAKEQAFR